MENQEKKELKTFTLKQLNEYNGTGDQPAYIALNGKVYDVSNSPLWRNGKHQGRHSAGKDLSLIINNAPHNDAVMAKFPIVGLLIEESRREKLAEKFESLHLHPILVHFSLAYSMAIPLLAVFYFLTDIASFEVASYYMLVLAFVAAPLSALTGFFSWRITYEHHMTRLFSRKIWLTILVTSIITICFVWRTLDPHILFTREEFDYVFLGLLDQVLPEKYIYFVLIFSLVPINILLGYFGGKIVYS